MDNNQSKLNQILRVILEVDESNVVWKLIENNMNGQAFNTDMKMQKIKEIILAEKPYPSVKSVFS